MSNHDKTLSHHETLTMTAGAVRKGNFVLKRLNKLRGVALDTPAAFSGSPSAINFRCGTSDGGQEVVADIDVKAQGHIQAAIVAGLDKMGLCDTANVTLFYQITAGGGSPAGSVDVSIDYDAATGRYANRAAAAGATISYDVDAIELDGYAAAGDEGGGLFRRVSSSTDSLHFTSADGAVWEPVGPVTVKAFGAVGDDTADDSAAFAAAVARGGDIIVPAGTYRLKTAVSSTDPIVLTRDTRVTCSAGARIVVDGSIAGIALYIWGVTTTAYQGSPANPPRAFAFQWFGGYLDASEVTAGANDKGEVFELVAVERPLFRDATMFAADNFTDRAADTAIALTDCGPSTIEGCWFYGFADQAIYLTGGNDCGVGDDGGPSLVVNSHFIDNTTAVSLKRHHHRVVFANNSVTNVHTGIGCYEVGADQEVEPGYDLIVADNLFKNSELAAIEVRGGKGRLQVIGNQIIDWGKNLENGAYVANASGLRVLGGREIEALGNTFRREDISFPFDGHATNDMIGIIEAEYTTLGDDETYTPGDNHYHGNTFVGLATCFYQTDDCEPSYCKDVNCVGMSAANPSRLVAGSHFSGFVASGDYRYYFNDAGTVKQVISISSTSISFG